MICQATGTTPQHEARSLRDGRGALREKEQSSGSTQGGGAELWECSERRSRALGALREEEQSSGSAQRGGAELWVIRSEHQTSPNTSAQPKPRLLRA